MEDLKEKVRKLLFKYEYTSQTVRDERQALWDVKGKLLDLEQAQHVAQQVAQEVQEYVHTRIASVVSKCLRAVFPDAYDFQILFERKRGKTEARLVFLRDGEEVDPKKAAGGGVLDVAAFALRLSCLLLTQPPPRRLLVLDEPFRFVSRGFRDRIQEMLLSLSKDMGLQIVMVTHSEELICGEVVHLG